MFGWWHCSPLLDSAIAYQEEKLQSAGFLMLRQTRFLTCPTPF
jgi:hypothetical protein